MEVLPSKKFTYLENLYIASYMVCISPCTHIILHIWPYCFFLLNLDGEEGLVIDFVLQNPQVLGNVDC